MGLSTVCQILLHEIAICLSLEDKIVHCASAHDICCPTTNPTVIVHFGTADVFYGLPVPTASFTSENNRLIWIKLSESLFNLFCPNVFVLSSRHEPVSILALHALVRAEQQGAFF